MFKDNQMVSDSLIHTETVMFTFRIPWPITGVLRKAMLPVQFLQYFKYRALLKAGVHNGGRVE